MTLGTWNHVKGRPGWTYGLLIRKNGAVVFDVFNAERGEKIEGLVASGYRTTRLARRMGERNLRGYQHEAQRAIRASEPTA